MAAPISESWTRIADRLVEHAPATCAALAPPADPAWAGAPLSQRNPSPAARRSPAGFRAA